MNESQQAPLLRSLSDWSTGLQREQALSWIMGEHVSMLTSAIGCSWINSVSCERCVCVCFVCVMEHIVGICVRSEVMCRALTPASSQVPRSSSLTPH